MTEEQQDDQEVESKQDKNRNALLAEHGHHRHSCHSLQCHRSEGLFEPNLLGRR